MLQFPFLTTVQYFSGNVPCCSVYPAISVICHPALKLAFKIGGALEETPGNKVIFKIFNTGFNCSFLLRTVWTAGNNHRVVVIGKFQKILIKLQIIMLIFEN